MKPSARKKSAQRERPDLPAEFESTPGEAAQWHAETEVITIQERHLEDLDAANWHAGAFSLEGCLLERVQFSGSQFGSATWKDVRLVGCDLANVRLHRIALVRVELVDCRLTGFRASALDWQDVLIQNGDVRYAQMQGGKFKHCEFEGCNWQEADLRNADLTGAVFRSCNLSRADLQGTTLRGADLRQSEIEGTLVGVKDVYGAIVDPAQAMVLARLLGLEIK